MTTILEAGTKELDAVGAILDAVGATLLSKLRDAVADCPEARMVKEDEITVDDI